MLERGPGPESQHIFDLFQGCGAFADAEKALLAEEKKPGGGDANELQRLNEIMNQGLEALKKVILAQAQQRGREALTDLDILAQKHPEIKSTLPTIQYELLCAMLDDAQT